MTLERIGALVDLRHGDRVRVTINHHAVKEGIVVIKDANPKLLYLCQSETDYLDGGHESVSRSAGTDYAWALLRYATMRYSGVQGLRRIVRRET